MKNSIKFFYSCFPSTNFLVKFQIGAFLIPLDHLIFESRKVITANRKFRVMSLVKRLDLAISSEIQSSMSSDI